MRHRLIAAALLFAPAIACGAAHADAGRDALTQTTFTVRDKATALAQLASVEAIATATLAKAPGDSEALMTRAMATCYRAKLTRNRSTALAAKAQFEAIVAANPRDAEGQAALGAWHLSVVNSLGAMLARGGLGARRGLGLEATDRAVALGGDRALYAGLAGLLRLESDPKDARGLALIELAAHAGTPTPLDRVFQHRALQLSAVIKGGDTRMIQVLAQRLLPLGQIKE